MIAFWTGNDPSSFMKTLKGEGPLIDDISRVYINKAKNLFEDATNKGFVKQEGSWFNRLQDIFNNFEQNSGIIGRMVYFSGKDVNDLGRFKEWRSSDDTRYIVFSVNGLLMGIYLAMWVPIECTEEYFSQFKPYLASFGNKVLDQLNIQQAYFQQELTAERFDFFDSAKRNAEVQTLRAGHYITIFIVIFLVTSVLVSTIIEIIERSKKEARRKAGIPEPEPRPKSCLQKYLSSFYLLENKSKLFFARSKDGDKNLEILNGVRVLSMVWVILGHTYYYSMQTALHNPLAPLQFLKSFSFNLVSSGPYSVDIFFWLSGFLGVYILLGSTHKRKGRMQNWLMIYLHRFLRIIPLYTITLLFFWFVMSAVGSGPIFFQYYNTGAVHWRRAWWIHLLFLNNFSEIYYYSNRCMGWTWYLPNDMQFFLLIPPLVWILYRSRLIGFMVVGFLQTAAFVSTFTIAWKGDMGPSYFRATTDYYRSYYERPWARISPFFIGVTVAVLLYSFKNDDPKNSIWKRIMDKIDQSRIIRFIMYVIGSFIFWTMIFIFYWINNYPESFSKGFNISFLTFSKALFVIGMNLVLLPVLMGHFSLLRNILAFDAFTPLARLTFGAYLVHPTIMLFDAMNTVRGEYITINFGIVRFLWWIVSSFAISLIVTLLVETPFMKLEKEYLMGGGRKRKPKGEIKEDKEPVEELDQGFKKSNEKLLGETQDRIIGNGMNHELDDIPDRRRKPQEVLEIKKQSTQKFSLNGCGEESEQSLTNVDATEDSIPNQNTIRKFIQNGH